MSRSQAPLSGHSSGQSYSHPSRRSSRHSNGARHDRPGDDSAAAGSYTPLRRTHGTASQEELTSYATGFDEPTTPPCFEHTRCDYSFSSHPPQQSSQGSQRGPQHYDPYQDPQYRPVPRPSRRDYSQLYQVMNNLDRFSAPGFQDPRFRSSNNPNYPQAALVHPVNQNSTHNGYGGSTNSTNVSQQRAIAPNHAEREWYRELQPRIPYSRLHDPYDGVGHVRRDGAVYDEEEEYKEYRPFGGRGR
ncbi:hypothetical protein PtrSN002B_010019 [Pyrenophora tritici-repentis]|uniref:Uncharacterized protein n=1 Tax=Pyrenophora tritici-repentis TaxID=45151 RepID=A0A2W1H2M1_9PLEO|nr:hypothetical protein PtrV1_00848 [Pyrenophora tritici-repentis]KAF7453567.1 hypothetical protein A1F99_008250 [Pyrenophora tritici-repentis]KAF7576647.1 hypothetical protein PtrM4_008870 [Pyrenophora tritici-repentis]KAG9387325.1 hypothetical protein A1F94_000217 [Pyrenophora tritici-repentis]KAI0571961.1 hypothetical protein Alg215_10072 [Pyrenophora tritici-repentis]